MIQQTLILIKPDGVARGLIGEIIKRFEQRGLKIVALKFVKINNDLAKQHYTEDISNRHGEKIRNRLLNFITEGPIVAMIIEGVNSIENARKLVGATESRKALPGTIRGDFSHVSNSYAEKKGIAIKNIVHASANETDAKNEIALWFSVNEVFDYKRAGDEHLL